MTFNEDIKEIKKWLQETRGLDSDLEIIDKEGSINFKCDGCRNGMSECCTNRNDIMISPYDMYKLQKGLNKSSEEIIDKYLEPILGSDSKIPMLIMKNNYYNGESICKFLKRIEIDGVKKRGCSIHGFKPSVCELYPIGRFTKINQKTKEKKMYYMVQSLSCGVPGDHKIKIRDWVPDIDNSERAFILFNDFIEKLYDIIDIKSFMNSDKIQAVEKNVFATSYYTALYTYDTNKDFFEQFETHAKVMLEIAEKFVEVLKKEDKKMVGK